MTEVCKKSIKIDYLGDTLDVLMGKNDRGVAD